jgi:disulfide oxidoreductase YuzD
MKNEALRLSCVMMNMVSDDAMAINTKKRKWPHQPARIQLVDVEEEDSDDETASAELNEE